MTHVDTVEVKRYVPPSDTARPVMLVGAPENYIQAIDSILQLTFSHTNRTIKALKPSDSNNNEIKVKPYFISNMGYSRDLILVMKKWAITCLKVDYPPSTNELDQLLDLSITARNMVYELVQDAKQVPTLKDNTDVMEMLDMIYRGLDSIVYIVSDELSESV